MLRDEFSKLPPQEGPPIHTEELADGSLRRRLEQMHASIKITMFSPGRDFLKPSFGHDQQESRYGLYYWSHRAGCITQFKGAALLQRVAERVSSTPHILANLARHCDENVRIAVAENENTSAETLLLLAADEHPDVRYTVAENYGCPMPVLAALTEDENPYIAHRAKQTLSRLTGCTILTPVFQQSEGVARFFSTR